MGQKPQILVDTDILIKVYRGHSSHKSELDKIQGNIAVSSITYLELLFGLKTRRRIIDLHKQMRSYHLVHLPELISVKAMDILNKYGTSNAIKPADSLIAATSLVTNMALFTNNKQDFDFIEGISFYK